MSAVIESTFTETRHDSAGPWRAAFRRLRNDRVGMICVVIVAAYMLLILGSALGLFAKDWNREVGVSYANPSFLPHLENLEAESSRNLTAVSKVTPVDLSDIDPLAPYYKELEERTANIPAVEKQWVAAKAAFEQFKTDAQDRLVRMQADLKAATEQLAITEPKLPPDVRAAYDRMVKGYGPDGLAAVVGRACQQCRTNLTEQQRNDLVRGSMFVTCPRCGRGLYLAEAA